MTAKLRDYGFIDWSGDSGFKFALGSSIYLAFCFPAAYAADETRVAGELPRGEGGLLWIGIPDPLMEVGDQ